MRRSGGSQYIRLVHIKEELKQLFGCEVDVVRIRQNMDALLKKDIIEEGIYV